MMFSNVIVNTGRQYEFDLAKAITIVLMVWAHVYETLSTGFAPSVSYDNAVVRSSILGAVTFMFCMGIGMAYTSHNSSKECLSRGFKLLTTGFILNFFRTFIPAVTASVIYSNHSVLQKIILCFSVDILQFAGLAFLLVGLLKRWNVGNTGMLLISLALSAAGTLLEGVQTGNYAIDQLLGFLWGTYSESYFPLFNWFIFVAAGQWFGEKYKYLQDKDKFHFISLIAGSLICAIYLYISLNVEQDVFKGITSELYFAHRPFLDALVCLPVNVAFISLCHYLGKIIPQGVMPVLTHPSKHINQYYCISWVIILGLAYDFPADAIDSESMTICFWLLILALTILSVTIYDRYLQQGVGRFFGRRRTFWTIFIWAVCIGAFIWTLNNFDSPYPNFINGYGRD